jgi:predicted dehydrogenase
MGGAARRAQPRADARPGRLTRLPAGHPEGWFDALRGVVADFYEAVRAAGAGREHDGELATFKQGHARVCLVEAVMESHRRQRWAPVAASSEVVA